MLYFENSLLDEQNIPFIRIIKMSSIYLDRWLSKRHAFLCFMILTKTCKIDSCTNVSNLFNIINSFISQADEAFHQKLRQNEQVKIKNFNIIIYSPVLYGKMGNF